MKYTVTDYAGFNLTFDNLIDAWTYVMFLKDTYPTETVTLEVE